MIGERLDVWDLLAPGMLISNLPWMLVLAWFSRRLLGLRRRSLWSSAAAGLIGWLIGSGIALLSIRGDVQGHYDAVWRIGVVLSVLFTMLATVGVELLARHREEAFSLPGTTIPHPVRSVRALLARVGRYIQVLRIAARHGLRMRPGHPPDRLPAREVRAALEECGGMFVKLGQMLATRPDVVGPSLAEELTGLQEDAPPAPTEDVDRLLQEEFGHPVGEVFERFDAEPIAAASIAQAHRARLGSGEEVIVKVQRPGVASLVERDLSILLRLTRRAERRARWAESYGVAKVAEEFAAGVIKELDFTIEARSVEEIGAALGDTPEIRVPHVFTELSTPRVLVLEFLQGVSVGQRERVRELGVDHEKLADVLLRSTISLVVGGERFHADPHPGNVMVLADGRLGLLDFGSTGRLDAIERASVVDMLTAIAQNDPELLRDAVLAIAVVRRRIEERALDRALAGFMARHLGRGAAPSVAMLQELAQMFLAMGIALPSTTTMLFRMLVTLEGTLTTLCPGYELIGAARDLAPELIRERLAPSRWQEQAREELMGLMPVLRRAPRHLDRVATILERGELATRVSLFATEDDQRVLRALVNRTLLVLTGGAVGVVAVGLLAVPGGPTVSGVVSLFDVLGYMGLFLSAVLLLRVTVAALIEGG
ncbi:MAG TPA: AarF/UbiB family protein [Actinomycetota bacterium]|nr:AarF/UbiB family protein [Actinomycetota bacterium]